MKKLLNAVGFQTAWWACILAAGRGQDTMALMYCLALGAAHLFFSGHRRLDIRCMTIAVVLGAVTDTLLQMASVVQFHGSSLGMLSPYWLWALWGLFAMTLNSSMSFLQNQAVGVVGLMGALFGPLTYCAGASSGAASMSMSAAHIGILALTWMIVLPVLVRISKPSRQVSTTQRMS